MPPPGVLFTPGEQRGAFREPVMLRGRRCGKYFVQQVLGCRHGSWRGETPAPEVEAKTLADTWNEWAEQAARAKADRLGLSVNRRALWFYYLGATSERPFVENV